MNFTDLQTISIVGAKVGDTLVFDGQAFIPQPNGVTSVNSQTGVVDLSSTDIPEGDNLYFTPDRVDKRIEKQSINSHVDVEIDNPTDNQFLTYLAGKWANRNLVLSEESVISALGYKPMAKTDVISVDSIRVKSNEVVTNLNASLLDSKPKSYFAEQAFTLICTDEVNPLEAGSLKFNAPFTSELTKLSVYFSKPAETDVILKLKVNDYDYHTFTIPSKVAKQKFEVIGFVKEDDEIAVEVVNPGVNALGMKINLYYTKV